MIHVDMTTVLGSMAITAILSALPKKGTKWTWSLLYDVPYDALTGFWSLKTGSKVPDPIPAVAPPTTK